MDTTDINELQRSLSRIEGKQDALLINQDCLREDYDTPKQDVTTLRFKLTGMLALSPQPVRWQCCSKTAFFSSSRANQ